MRLRLVLVILASIATTACRYEPAGSGLAELDSNMVDDAEAPGDLVVLGDPDGPSPDAPPGMVTAILSQSTSLTGSNGNAPYCNSSTVQNRNNRWYRVFRLSDPEHGITGPTFHVTRVLFTSQDARDATVTVRLHGYTGRLCPRTGLSAAD